MMSANPVYAVVLSGAVMVNSVIKNDIEIIYGKVDEMQAMMDDWNATIRSPYAVVVDLIKQVLD